MQVQRLRSHLGYYLKMISLFFISVVILYQPCHAQYSNDCRSIYGKMGTCVPLAICPLFSSWLKVRPLVKENLRLIVKYTCYFDSKHPKVCCPNDNLFNSEEDGISVVGVRVGAPFRREVDSNSPSRNKLTFPSSTLQFPTSSAPSTHDEQSIRVHPSESNRRDYVPLTFPVEKQERAKSIWDGLRNKDAFFHQKDFRQHPNFRLIPKLEECSNAIKLDSLVGTYGTYPWIALVGLKTGKRTTLMTHICSGALINSRHVITSQHCFGPTKPGYVRLGEYNLGSLIDQGSEYLPQSRRQDFKIEKHILYPGYDPSTGNGDLALIRLEKPVLLNTTFIKAICLPFLKEYEIGNRLDLNNLDGKPAWTAGWSRHSWGGVYSQGYNTDILQEGVVEFTTYNNCRHDYPQLSALSSKTQLCVGGSGRKNSCAPDSGGPLMVPLKVPSKIPGFLEPKFFLLGLLSHGPTGNACQKAMSTPTEDGEGRSLLPTSVFTKVSKYLSWILDNIED